MVFEVGMGSEGSEVIWIGWDALGLDGVGFDGIR